MLMDNIDSLQMAYQLDDIIFTHAGVTKTWLESKGFKEGDIVDFINKLFKEDYSHFNFSGWDPYGNNVTQGPTWVRPESLIKDAYGKFKYVFGHTSMNKISPYHDRFYPIDVMGTSQEFLIVEDGKISIGK